MARTINGLWIGAFILIIGAPVVWSLGVVSDRWTWIPVLVGIWILLGLAVILAAHGKARTTGGSTLDVLRETAPRPRDLVQRLRRHPPIQ